jgi:hypothetical protein
MPARVSEFASPAILGDEKPDVVVRGSLKGSASDTTVNTIGRRP